MELEKLIVPLIANLDEWSKNLKKAQTEAEGVAKKTSGIFKAAGGIAAAGFTAIVGAGTTAVAMASDWNGKLDEVMDKTGMLSDEAAGLISMQEYLGGSTEDLSKFLVFMGKDAEKDSSAIASLGISVYDASGNMRSSASIFQDVADKLSAMPDGIEKTNLMMEIFGKTGSEAGDLLAEAANGGVQTYIDRAKELGLATDPQKAIEFAKAQQELNQTIQGLAVSIGTTLMPVLTPLLTKLAEMAAKYLPPIVSFIQKNFIPIIIVLSAMFLIWAANAAIAAVSTIAAMAPVILIIMAIAAAVAFLVFYWKTAWETNKEFFTNLWENKLKPIFNAIKNWFDTKIPLALDFLKNFWNGTIKKVFDGIKGAFDGIAKAIQSVIDWVGKLIDKFKKVVVPKVLTPGSPTPFEMGLRGINKELEKSATKLLPTFSAQLNMSTLSQKEPNEPIDYNKLALAMRDAVVMAVG